MAELNTKQQRFADEYIVCGNATDAAIKAGYSEKTAYSQGQRLLKKVEVQKYIQGAMEKLQDERILTQKEVLIILSDIARGEAKEYKEVVTKKGEYVDNPNSDKQQLVYNEYAEMIALPTKNSDRNKAAELIGKRYGMWTEKQEIEHSGAVQFVDDIGDDDEG
ncbi:terminase small subunit [Salibacterium lacus]|uniref:Terminase small subunit n=1 Tax=Salibacterium lacus TaxID=1898109 RepID=A0ABW5T017_9BACI